MVDTLNTSVAVAPATPKKSPKVKKEKKTAVKPSHPSTIVMVIDAVKELKERGGSSLQAIKKYIASTYKVDANKLAPFIRKAIKSSVESGTLVQTKGNGASGSFKIPGPVKSDKTKKAVPKPKVDNPKTDDKPAAVKKSPTVKKAAKPKKSPVKKGAVKPKSPSKVKKTTKVPTMKPKSPKAKTAKKTVKSPKKK